MARVARQYMRAGKSGSPPKAAASYILQLAVLHVDNAGLCQR
jgi:hypothetical protein